MNYLTTKEAAKKLFVSDYTVRKYIRQGRLAAAKVNKHYLISEQEIETFLKSITFKQQPA